jgi:hypothetical protein
VLSSRVSHEADSAIAVPEQMLQYVQYKIQQITDAADALASRVPASVELSVYIKRLAECLEALPTDQLEGLSSALTRHHLAAFDRNVIGDSEDISSLTVLKIPDVDVPKLNLDVNNMAELAETKVAEMAGLTTVQKGLPDEYQQIIDRVENPEGAKEEVVERVRQVALNHFSGKQEALQQAVDKVAKYKEKYESVSDISSLPKRLPNAMKGKPLLDRLIPGFALQVMTLEDGVLFDFNPYVGYRITGRLNGGAGWNQRIGINSDQLTFTRSENVFGPRVFTELSLWKGFFPRLEVEVMNTDVSTSLLTRDLSHREWVWGVFIGLKKEYRFLKSIKGTAMIMTRLFDPNHKSPYADFINARFGFEFPARKKR